MFMHHQGQYFDTDNIGTKVLITTSKTTFLDVQFYVSSLRFLLFMCGSSHIQSVLIDVKY